MLVLANRYACVYESAHIRILSCCVPARAAAALALQKHMMFVVSFGKSLISRVSASTSTAHWGPIQVYGYQTSDSLMATSLLDHLGEVMQKSGFLA